MEAEVRHFEDGVGKAQPLTGSLRIMTSEDLMAGILDSYLARFREEFPGIALDLIVDSRNLSLSKYEADVAVQTVPPRELEDEVGKRVCAVAWSCYATDRYMGQIPSPEGPTDLTQHRILVPLDRPHVRRWLEKPPRLRPASLRSTSLMTLREAARQGLGLAILPCYVGDPINDLRRVFQPIEDLIEELWIVSHHDVRNTARARAFFDCVGKLTRDQRALLEGRRPSPRHRTRAQSRT